MDKKKADETNLAVVTVTMARMGEDLKEMKQDLKELKGVYPTKDELEARAQQIEALVKAVDIKYELSRTLIFGFCALALMAVVGGLLALVINR